MERKKRHKLADALTHLERALQYYEQAAAIQQDVAFLAVAKAFEVAVEYAWKELKSHVEEEGLDAASPKDAIRQAATIGRIADAEQWLDFINARNNSVHDYFGIPEKDFVALARTFLHAGRSLTMPIIRHKKK